MYIGYYDFIMNSTFWFILSNCVWGYKAALVIFIVYLDVMNY